MDGIVTLLIALISAALAGTAGWIISSKFQIKKILEAKGSAKSIIEEARKEAEAIKKELILEGRDQVFKMRSEAEKEIQAKQSAVQKRESQLNQRELNIERKADLLDKKSASMREFENDLKLRMKSLELKDRKLAELIEEQNQKLERIAGMSAEEAKNMLMDNLIDKAKQDASRKIKDIKDEAVRTANREAKKIIVSAIQRTAADLSAETTVSVVSLPNDSMKGRIIGREGRNIRSFESLTGVEVIVDDTPEAVVISGFDPIRREIARIALEKLIADGRIHPARIEDVVEKAGEEVNESMREAAEAAVMELGLPEFHEEIVKLVGKMKYRTSYGQNVLQHSKEVAVLTGLMAAELNFDPEVAKISGFLHDIGKVVDQSVTGPHAKVGAEIVKKYMDNKIIINAVESHHEDTEMIHPISALVQAADAISGARRGARGDTLEGYIKRLEKLEEIAESFRGVSKTYAIQAGREIRVMVENETIDDAQADTLAEDIAEKIQSELEYPGQIKVVVIREHRSIGYAK